MIIQFWLFQLYLTSAMHVRGYELPGDMNCQRIWTARGYELSEDMNCQGIWTVRGYELPGDMNCQGIWTARGYELSEDMNCQGIWTVRGCELSCLFLIWMPLAWVITFINDMCGKQCLALIILMKATGHP